MASSPSEEQPDSKHAPSTSVSTSTIPSIVAATSHNHSPTTTTPTVTNSSTTLLTTQALHLSTQQAQPSYPSLTYLQSTQLQHFLSAAVYLNTHRIPPPEQVAYMQQVTTNNIPGKRDLNSENRPVQPRLMLESENVRSSSPRERLGIQSDTVGNKAFESESTPIPASTLAKSRNGVYPVNRSRATGLEGYFGKEDSLDPDQWDFESRAGSLEMKDDSIGKIGVANNVVQGTYATMMEDDGQCITKAASSLKGKEVSMQQQNPPSAPSKDSGSSGTRTEAAHAASPESQVTEVDPFDQVLFNSAHIPKSTTNEALKKPTSIRSYAAPRTTSPAPGQNNLPGCAGKQGAKPVYPLQPQPQQAIPAKGHHSPSKESPARPIVRTPCDSHPLPLTAQRSTSVSGTSDLSVMHLPVKNQVAAQISSLTQAISPSRSSQVSHLKSGNPKRNQSPPKSNTACAISPSRSDQHSPMKGGIAKSNRTPQTSNAVSAAYSSSSSIATNGSTVNAPSNINSPAKNHTAAFSAVHLHDDLEVDLILLDSDLDDTPPSPKGKHLAKDTNTIDLIWSDDDVPRSKTKPSIQQKDSGTQHTASSSTQNSTDGDYIMITEKCKTCANCKDCKGTGEIVSKVRKDDAPNARVVKMSVPKSNEASKSRARKKGAGKRTARKSVGVPKEGSVGRNEVVAVEPIEVLDLVADDEPDVAEVAKEKGKGPVEHVAENGVVNGDASEPTEMLNAAEFEPMDVDAEVTTGEPSKPEVMDITEESEEVAQPNPPEPTVIAANLFASHVLRYSLNITGEQRRSSSCTSVEGLKRHKRVGTGRAYKRNSQELSISSGAPIEVSDNSEHECIPHSSANAIKRTLANSQTKPIDSAPKHSNNDAVSSVGTSKSSRRASTPQSEHRLLPGAIPVEIHTQHQPLPGAIPLHIGLPIYATDGTAANGTTTRGSSLPSSTNGRRSSTRRKRLRAFPLSEESDGQASASAKPSPAPSNKSSIKRDQSKPKPKPKPTPTPNTQLSPASNDLSELWMRSSQAQRVSTPLKSDNESVWTAPSNDQIVESVKDKQSPRFPGRRLKKRKRDGNLDESNDGEISTPKRALKEGQEYIPENILIDTSPKPNEPTIPYSWCTSSDDDDTDVGYIPKAVPKFKAYDRKATIPRRKHHPSARHKNAIIKQDKPYDVRLNPFRESGKEEVVVVGCGHVWLWGESRGWKMVPKRRWDMRELFKLDQADYADSSLEKEPPDLFCCDWLLEEEKGECLVAVGGSDGVLVVCAPETGSHKQLYSHGGDINYIQTHPTNPILFASASEDLSARLWNGRTGHLIAIFAPAVEFQRSGLLSLAWNPQGTKLLTGEKDGTIRLWKTDTQAIKRATEYSFHAQPSSLPSPPVLDALPGPTYQEVWPKWMGEAWRDCRNGEASKMGDEEIRRTSVAFEKIPIMSSPWVFHGHIDWVCWWGEFCLAKSSFGCIKMFQPEIERHPGLSDAAKRALSEEIFYLHQFTYPDHVPSKSLWFVRAALSPSGRFLAVGNMIGVIYIWDIPLLLHRSYKGLRIGSVKDRWGRYKLTTMTEKEKKDGKLCQVRAISWSGDEKFLVAVLDDGRIWRCSVD